LGTLFDGLGSLLIGGNDQCQNDREEPLRTKADKRTNRRRNSQAKEQKDKNGVTIFAQFSPDANATSPRSLASKLNDVLGVTTLKDLLSHTLFS
jgi:hypothetical protein